MAVGNEGEARGLMLSILPESEARQKCLMVFAEAIVKANSCGRDVWAVTHTRDKVRLVVGHVIVCTLKNRSEHGPIWMALDKGLVSSSKYPLEQSGDWEWDNDRYPEYTTIESRNGYYSPSERHAELWDSIKHLHYEAISKAANQTTMDPRTPNGHTPEILAYIGKELGRQLPDPHYEPHGGKEQPPKSVKGDARLSSDGFVSGRVFGHIPGHPEGSRFESRAELSEAGVHRPTVAGISGSEREGADSIVS